MQLISYIQHIEGLKDFSASTAVSGSNYSKWSNSLMAGNICYQIEVHAVTKSFPSSGISFLQPPPHGTDTSQITFPYSVDAPMNSPSSEQATSKQLKYIHMVWDRRHQLKLIMLKINLLIYVCIPYFIATYFGTNDCLME